jgi:alpha 1,2-mannosyltransferase
MFRLPKVLFIAPITLILYVAFIWTRDRPTFATSTTLHGILSRPDLLPKFAPDAHRFATADGFMPHFKAVIQLPSMTMAEAKSGCNWESTNKVNFQYTADRDWIIEERSDQEIETQRKEWRKFLDTGLLSYEAYKKRFEGRGIVIVAGNERSMKRVRVVLRALDRLKCQLPIEIHYWKDELAAATKQNISEMWTEIYFNDLSDATNIFQTHHNDVANYQLKNAAVLNSRFAEPLLLDSDNVPVLDPESLYESSEYHEYGTLFWPDIARTRPQNPVWAVTNTPCRMDEYEQESGQLLVDKQRFFYHLQLAAFLNTKQSWYYHQFLLGDKDTFRFAWHALKTRFGTPRKWLTSVGTVVGEDAYYCGHTFAQHHPDGRVAFLHGGLIKMMPEGLMRWHRDNNGGIWQVYKRSDSDERPSVVVDVGLKYDLETYLPDKPANMTFGVCTELADVKTRPLDDIIPGFEKTFSEIGGYWMLDD